MDNKQGTQQAEEVSPISEDIADQAFLLQDLFPSMYQQQSQSTRQELHSPNHDDQKIPEEATASCPPESKDVPIQPSKISKKTTTRSRHIQARKWQADIIRKAHVRGSSSSKKPLVQQNSTAEGQAQLDTALNQRETEKYENDSSDESGEPNLWPDEEESERKENTDTNLGHTATSESTDEAPEAYESEWKRFWVTAKNWPKKGTDRQVFWFLGRKDPETGGVEVDVQRDLDGLPMNKAQLKRLMVDWEIGLQGETIEQWQIDVMVEEIKWLLGSGG